MLTIDINSNSAIRELWEEAGLQNPNPSPSSSGSDSPVNGYGHSYSFCNEHRRAPSPSHKDRLAITLIDQERIEHGLK